MSEAHEADIDGGGSHKGEQTRARIKRAALTLFAQKGLDGVSVREILKLAGQKNAGSINYYFSSRADLVQELIRDVAVILDEHHTRRLDALEAAGGPHTLRELAEILIDAPSLSDPNRQEDDRSLRFLNMVLLNHRQNLFDAMRGLDGGTRRCLTRMREMMPEIPQRILAQRQMLAMIYVIGATSTREAARDDPDAWARLWGGEATRETLADTVVGIMTAPVDAATLAALARDEARGQAV
ncbi:TetR/AcrR family transcriptional regulator [Rhodovulum sp. DZ06]|uniref:TetR/AcrR family transcriptional regulator n=1 Tax=Rhodovulum sp. DZ06 TaxID=3425126 RepID=UPI003D3594EF